MENSALIRTKKKWSEFESFVEGVLYDRDLSISARLFGLFLHSIFLPFLVHCKIEAVPVHSWTLSQEGGT